MSATISLLFGLLVAIVILATLATRLRIPYAILLVLGGLLLGFAHRCSGIQCDRTAVGSASSHRDHNRGREHG